MNILRYIGFLVSTVIALALSIAPSYAADKYCEGGSVTFYDGMDNTISWTVTSARARTVQNIGQEKPTRGCRRDFRTIGTVISRVLVQKPTLGRAREVNRYRVYYESDKAGNDEIAYKTTWESRGKISSAVLRIKIKVVDHPI